MHVGRVVEGERLVDRAAPHPRSAAPRHDLRRPASLRVRPTVSDRRRQRHAVAVQVVDRTGRPPDAGPKTTIRPPARSARRPIAERPADAVERDGDPPLPECHPDPVGQSASWWSTATSVPTLARRRLPPSRRADGHRSSVRRRLQRHRYQASGAPVTSATSSDDGSARSRSPPRCGPADHRHGVRCGDVLGRLEQRRRRPRLGTHSRVGHPRCTTARRPTTTVPRRAHARHPSGDFTARHHRTRRRRPTHHRPDGGVDQVHPAASTSIRTWPGPGTSGPTLERQPRAPRPRRYNCSHGDPFPLGRRSRTSGVDADACSIGSSTSMDSRSRSPTISVAR